MNYVRRSFIWIAADSRSPRHKRHKTIADLFVLEACCRAGNFGAAQISTALATPCHESSVFLNYVLSAIRLQNTCFSGGLRLDFFFRHGDSLDTRARNDCVAYFQNRCVNCGLLRRPALPVAVGAPKDQRILVTGFDNLKPNPR
jgi:hypothetical protein